MDNDKRHIDPVNLKNAGLDSFSPKTRGKDYPAKGSGKDDVLTNGATSPLGLATRPVESPRRQGTTRDGV